MIYLDYSATTNVKEEVLERINNTARKYFYNPNSHYQASITCKTLIDEDTNKILNYFKVPGWDLIYTSGASESNNTIIKGICDIYPGKTIITTKLEHSSIIAPLGYLQKKGYKVLFVDLKEDGSVDLEHLKSLITSDTVLVSIAYVNSEIGILEPISEIGKLVHECNPNAIFHTDMTQAVGKINISLDNVDCASFSGHKIHTFKGIGGLLKKKEIKMIPLIHGGRSTTDYRSGTPQTELIDSLAYAIDLIDIKYDYVLDINKYLLEGLKKYNRIKINSTNKSIPHILNISILGIPSDKTQEYFANQEIYISTKTACSTDGGYSLAVYSVTNDMERASSSVRISLSNLTTKKEIDKFLRVLDKLMEEYENN